MGFLSSLGGVFGLGAGKGGNFNAKSAPIAQGVNVGQTSNAYNSAQSGISQQQAFLNALMAQNGIGNQANVFSQQQGLANQLQGLANGTGPNPALQQLQNTTGQNVANQASLMAGQRGAGSNAGLLARQAGMQGANIQQQAVGQGAALSAQQQIAGMNALQQQQGMMGNLAGTQIGQQAGALTGYNQAAQSEQQNLLNALAQFNNANVANAAQQNQSNAGVQSKTAGIAGDLIGGLISGAGKGAAAGAAMAAHGGIVQNYADGGSVGPQSMAGKFLYNSAPANAGPDPINLPQQMNVDYGKSQMYGAGAHLGSMMFQGAPPQQSMNGPPDMSAHNRGFGHAVMYGGGEAKSPKKDEDQKPQDKENLSSKLEAGAKAIKDQKQNYQNMFDSLNPMNFQAQGGPINGEILAAQGKIVPGKASVKGDSLKNDTVPAMLSPGEVIIPRHVMQSNDPVGNSAKFVQAILAQNSMRRK